ncbi:unnamed protein product [Effrenium voratum]|nr:unnamed protein product [Effrenium voratum]
MHEGSSDAREEGASCALSAEFWILCQLFKLVAEPYGKFAWTCSTLSLPYVTFTFTSPTQSATAPICHHHGRSSSQTNGPGSTDVSRDNLIPLFDGKPAFYKEYRKRIMLYYLKMSINNKKKEATVNLLTSLSGPAWRQVKHMVDAAAAKDDGFQDVIQQLDKAFQYDRVEMPRTFEKFFFRLQRRPEMNLLTYCTEHREHLREIEKHKINLPPTISEWLLLRRANLTAEQRQLVMTHTSGELKVEESLYYLFGQDYTSRPTHRPQPGMAEEQSFDPPTSGPTTASRASPTMCRTMPISRKTTPSPSCDGVLEADYVPEDEEIFWEAEEDYPADPEAAEDESHQEEEEVYAAYMDARRKLAKVRSARGYNRLSPSVRPAR